MIISDFNNQFHLLKKELSVDYVPDFTKTVKRYHGLAQSVVEKEFILKQLPLLKRMRSDDLNNPIISDDYVSCGFVVLKHFELIYEQFFFQKIFTGFSQLGEEFWILKDCYEKGNHTQKNRNNAQKACLMAAECGLTQAQYEMGLNYETGTSISQDYSLALRYYEKAAESGNVEAMYRTAMMYYQKGNGAKTISWLETADARGYLDAACAMGICYEIGFGVRKNYEQAVIWYQKAAKNKDDFALLRLGIRFLYKDKGKAIEYSQESAEYGNEMAEELLESLE